MSLLSGRLVSFPELFWSGDHDSEDSSVILPLTVMGVVLTTGKRKPGWSVTVVMEMELPESRMRVRLGGDLEGGGDVP